MSLCYSRYMIIAASKSQNRSTVVPNNYLESLNAITLTAFFLSESIITKNLKNLKMSKLKIINY